MLEESDPLSAAGKPYFDEPDPLAEDVGSFLYDIDPSSAVFDPCPGEGEPMLE